MKTVFEEITLFENAIFVALLNGQMSFCRRLHAIVSSVEEDDSVVLTGLSLFRLIVVPSRSHYSTRADEKKANGRRSFPLLSLLPYCDI